MLDDRVRQYAQSYQIDPEQPTKFGIFIIHGFASNPDVFRPYATKFAENGFHTYVSRIAGHGTTPEHFATTTRFEWSQSVVQQFIEFNEKMDNVIVLGHSLGALHAIEIGTAHELEGLLLLAPPIIPKSKILIKFHSILPFLAKFKKFWRVPKWKVKLLRERGANIYEKHPLVAFDQMLRLIEETNALLPDLSCKTLIILGDSEEFVSQQTIEILIEHLENNNAPYKKWIAPDGSHALIDTSDYETLENVIIEFVKEIKRNNH